MERGDTPDARRNRFAERFDDPAQIHSYLDFVSAQSFARDYKARTFQLLNLRPGHRVLEVGCGLGDDARALGALVGPGGRVVGLDANAATIAQARQRSGDSGLPVEFTVGDAHALDFPDETFDGVRADRTMQHLADLPRALSEMVRVLRRGGRVVVFDPDWDSLLVDASDRSVARAIMAFRCDGYAQGWVGRQYFRLLTQAGLSGVDVTPCPFVSTDLAVCDDLFGLQKAATAAAAGGAVEPAAADQWWEGLKAAAAAGEFFCAVLTFIAVGTKP